MRMGVLALLVLLKGRDLKRANLERAVLLGVDLAGASLRLSNVACGDAKTVLRPGLKAPAPWPCED